MAKNFFQQLAKDMKPKADAAPDIVFNEADPNLDVFTQARMNLSSFKDYFSQTTYNAPEIYETVNASLSKAYGLLTNRCAELEINAESNKKDIESIENDTNIQKDDLVKTKEMLEQVKTRNEFLKKQQTETNEQVGQMQASKAIKDKEKSELDAITKELAELTKDLNEKIAIQKEAKQKADGAIDSLNDAIEKNEKEKQKLLNELSESEKKISKLKEEVKNVEREAELIKKKAESTPPPKRRVSSAQASPEKSTFVIKDNLRIANAELKGLAQMVESIEQENETLDTELQSLKMDMDCLMQQNIGLKQIIREIMEPNNK